MSTDCLLIAQMLKFKQKRDIKRPDFRKNDVYTSFTDVLRLFHDSLLITQMLKFKQKRDIKQPDFRKK